MKIILFILFPFLLWGDVIQRDVIGFWDSKKQDSPDDSLIHVTLEMPLNHLGLNITYYDIRNPLPKLSSHDNFCGILVSFHTDTQIDDPRSFIDWCIEAMDSGKKLILMNNVGFLSDINGAFTSIDLQNKLFERLGFTKSEDWIEYSPSYQILHQDKVLFPFEKKYPQPLPGFYQTRIYDFSVKPQLRVGIPGKHDTEADLIIISPSGGFVSQYFSNTFDKVLFDIDPRSIGWYFDPFRFFELIFNLSKQPIPDTTTLAGKRIYCATCHGDNWNTTTTLEEYEGKNISCAEVILEKIVKPYPDLPVSIGVVAADVDPQWVGKKASQEVARKTFELPQVEAASHTYSHPFEWGFFRTGQPEKEIDFLYLYPQRTWKNSYLSWLRSKYYRMFKPEELEKNKLKWGYIIPRAYANHPFDLKQEIFGSIAYVNQFAPPNNQVKLLIWSGDSRPWDTVLEMVYEAGVKSYGGGTVRLDEAKPSYLFVYPLGRKPGGFFQTYSAANSEDDYTDNWSDHFYGFKYVVSTLKNTESPRRIKPILLYYHSYSGQFQSSVDAVISNIEFIKTQHIIPLKTTRYCEIAEGFVSTQIESMGPNKWKFYHRNGLQTIRFDGAESLIVNPTESLGVIGWTWFQESLYVYLDAGQKESIITLISRSSDNSHSSTPYLIDSNWEIWNLKNYNNELNFKAKGWGKLTMRWKMPLTGSYAIHIHNEPISTFETTSDHVLLAELDLPYDTETDVSIKQTK